MDFMVLKSETSNVTNEDLNVIDNLIRQDGFEIIFACNYIHLEAGTISENNEDRVIEIEKKIFGTGTPNVTLVIGSYVE